MKKGLSLLGVLLIFLTIDAGAQLSKKKPLQQLHCSTLVGRVMLQEVDTTKPRGVSDNYHTWNNGQVLLVKFIGGGTILRNKVIQCAREWEKYANVTFKFVADTTKITNIRITLGGGLGHNSAVGTEANFRPQSMQTMNFDTLYLLDADYYFNQMEKKGLAAPYTMVQFVEAIKTDPDHWSNEEIKRVVTHEFGHSLGLLHEQSYPGAVNWKKTDSIYQYYKDTQGWDRDKVDFNVFEVSNQFYTNGTTYDPKSIMHYSINSWETTDGYSLEQNNELSDGDKKLISALYPKNQKESSLAVPKVDITSFKTLTVLANKAKNGLSIYPVFDLKTNSKLGQVYVVARMATEDGYYLQAVDKYFNWGGTSATYIKMNLLPNSKASYNSSTKKNLELFIPYNQIPDLKGKRLMIVFAIYLDDELNGQRDKLMYFSKTTPLSLPR